MRRVAPPVSPSRTSRTKIEFEPRLIVRRQLLRTFSASLASAPEHAADRLVGVEQAEAGRLVLLPSRLQRHLQQRQIARLVRNVALNRLDERRLVARRSPARRNGLQTMSRSPSSETRFSRRIASPPSALRRSNRVLPSAP